MPVITYTAAGPTALVAKTRAHRVQLWGGGGTGGPAQGNPSTTGGGAGAQFVTSRRNLAPGTSYNVAVAQLATSLTTAAVSGSDTTFNATDVVAKGGVGSAAETGVNGSGTGAAGSTSGGVGDTVFAGGSGGNSTVATPISGGGGGGAGSSGTGASGSGGTQGGATATNGGAGGAGVAVTNTRNAGSNYGGGGSGAYTSAASDRRGGDGAAGLAIVDWIPPCSLLLLGVG